MQSMRSTVAIGEIITVTAPRGTADLPLLFAGLEDGAQYEVLGLFFQLQTSVVVDNRIPTLEVIVGGLLTARWMSSRVQAASDLNGWSVLPDAIETTVAGLQIIQGNLPKIHVARNGVKQVRIVVLDGDVGDVITNASLTLRKLEWVN